MNSMTQKKKCVFNTSGLYFCQLIIDAAKDNIEIIVSPLVSAHFSKKEIGYSIEILTESDKKYVYNMIRRYLNKELATNYRKGRKTSHAGEFESIAIAKRLGIPVIIHDKMARTWAKMERVKPFHPIDLPEIFARKLPREKLIEFLKFHCKMKYEPACKRLEELQHQ